MVRGFSPDRYQRQSATRLTEEITATLMANPEHLAKLMQGVEAWREWRKQNFVTFPKLSEADVPGASLRGADLGSADLGSTDLGSANLGGAILSRAYLHGARRNGAMLSGAKLSEASLFEATSAGRTSTGRTSAGRTSTGRNSAPALARRFSERPTARYSVANPTSNCSEIARQLAPFARSAVILSLLTIRRGRPSCLPLARAFCSPAFTRS